MSLRLFLCLSVLAVSSLHAGATLEAFGEIPATARDSLGDTIGGLGSAIARDDRTGDFFMLPDRGAGDGTIDYRPRMYRLRIERSQEDPRRLDCRVVETILFRDQRGRTFTGLLADAIDTPTRQGRRCLDPEALAIAPDGTFYVSDEYTPSLLQFQRDGRLIREIPLPAWTQPHDRKGRVNYRDASAFGRDENRGAEALGILPGGKQAVLIFQSALLQDGGKPAGTTRILVLDLADGRPVAEYAYPFGPSPAPFRDLSVNDLAVVDKNTLLVLERDGSTGRSGPVKHPAARYKAVWMVDLRGATDLLRLKGQPYDLPPSEAGFKPLTREADVRFVGKRLVFNLPELVPQLGLDPSLLAAKWEGIVLIPPRSKKDFRLLMTADNDFLAPTVQFDGKSTKFPRAKDAVPTQIFEILAPRP